MLRDVWFVVVFGYLHCLGVCFCFNELVAVTWFGLNMIDLVRFEVFSGLIRGAVIWVIV